MQRRAGEQMEQNPLMEAAAGATSQEFYTLLPLPSLDNIFNQPLQSYYSLIFIVQFYWGVFNIYKKKIIYDTVHYDYGAIHWNQREKKLLKVNG